MIPYCPRCAAYKTAAYKLAHQLRDAEAAIKADAGAVELKKAIDARNKAEGEVDRLRVEKASEWKLPTMEEFEKQMGYEHGEHIPSRGQWLEALGLAEKVDGLVDEHIDELPPDFVVRLKKLIGRE